MTKPAFIAIDAGTTNTRGWRVRDGQLEAYASHPIGVRDTAKDGHNRKLVSALRELVITLREDAPIACVAAAGMITSSLGLKEIVHCDAPVGVLEIAARGQELRLPEICDVPIWLFPGVRCGDWKNPEAAESCDMMRGEETLCLGLAETRPGAPMTVVNLGSHWKSIRVDAQGRITGSWTTLSGELLHAIVTQTILASAVPSGRPEDIDVDWLQRGGDATRRDGFSRALFETRLWEVRAGDLVAPTQRLSFLVGALVEESLAAFRAAGELRTGHAVLIGQGGVASGWRKRLERDGLTVEVIDPEQTAECFVRGICQLITSRCRS